MKTVTTNRAGRKPKIYKTTSSVVSLPILDPQASRVRKQDVWALEEWLKHHEMLPPRKALQLWCSESDLPVPTREEVAQEARTLPRYIRDVMCRVHCRDAASGRDPMIVGCKVYGKCYCPLWPYRRGKNPNRRGLGPKRPGIPKRRVKVQPAEGASSEVSEAMGEGVLAAG